MPAKRHTVLCVSSYYKGNRFLQRCRQESCHVILLTVESLLAEAWPRDQIDEVYALPSFGDQRTVINAVAYLARTRPIDRAVALDEFDVEMVAFLREHFGWPGMGASAARLFRDKLAMRWQAQARGVRVPEFTALFPHDAVRHFVAEVPPPWLLKPRFEASAVGIKQLHRGEDVWPAIEALGDEQSYYLLERMVAGDLYHVDALATNGTLAFAQVGKYHQPLLEVWQSGGIFATRTLSAEHPEAAELRRLTEQVLAGFGMDRGATHTEFLRGRDDGQFYLIETSARVGGANITEMVEAATGVNLWEEWAKIEIDRDEPYATPPLRGDAAGVIVSLARQARPDTSGFTDPEIFYRLDKKHHVGFVVRSPSPERVELLLGEYRGRIQRDFHAALPPSDRPVA